MTGEIHGNDPLRSVVSALRQPMPVAPGLATRAAARARRQRRRRMATSVGVAALAVASVMLVRQRYAEPVVTFSIAAPAVRSVALVGDFTDWKSDRVQLVRASSGVWRATVRLAPGRYRFAYLVDQTQWRADSGATPAPDDFGRPTSIVTVVGN